MSTLEAEHVVPGHTVVRVVSTGPTGAVLLAREDAPPRRSVLVKTYRPAVLEGGEAERTAGRRRVRAFLDAARLQQRLATAPDADHWAPVHTFGPLADAAGADGAFYTTDEFPASAAWLVKGQVRLSSAGLRRVVAGVVAGVAEVRACCGRGHGNLTPTNILLTGRDPRSFQVRLTDPAREFTDAPPPVSAANDGAAVADDRWAVGALIYTLVTHKPVRASTLLPAEPDADWSSLGPDAERWLAVCGRLLSRDPAQRPDLSTVLADVGPTGPRRRSKVVRVAAWSAAALLVVAAGATAGLAEYVHLYHKACATLGDIHAPWVRSLVDNRRPLRDALAADTAAGDAALRARLPDLLDSIARTTAVDPKLHAIPTWSAFRSARSAAGTLDEVRLLLDAKQWPLLGQVKALQAQAKQAGLPGLADDLDHLATGLPPAAGGPQAAANLIAFVRSAPDAQRRADAMVDWWRGLSRDLAALAASTDPAAHGVGTAVARRWADALRLGPDAPALPLPTATVLTCDSLIRYVGQDVDPPQDYAALATTVPDLFDADHRPPELADWLAALKRRQAVDLALVPAVRALADAVTRSGQLLDTLPASAPTDHRAALRDRYAAVVRQADALRGRAWPEGRLDDLARQCDAARASLADLAGAVHLEEVDVWLTALSHQGIPADAVAWQSAVDGLAGERTTLAADPARLAARQRQAAVWVDALRDLGPAIAQAAAVPAAFADAAAARYRHEAWAALPAVDVAQPPPRPADVLAALPRRSAWVRQFDRFRLDFPLRVPWTDLPAADAVRHRWATADAPSDQREFWQQEVVAAAGSLHGSSLLAGDVARFAAIDRTGRMDRAALTRTCRDPAGAPELALVARLRLDALAGADVWPRTEAELSAAAQWPLTVSPAAARFRLTPADLAARGRQAWARFVIADGSPDRLRVAVAAAGALGIADLPTAAAALAGRPAAYYDLLVCMAQMPAAQQLVGRPQFDAAVAALPAADQAAVRRALAAVPADQVQTDAQFCRVIGDRSWYVGGPGPFAPRAVFVPPAVANNPNPTTGGGPAAAGQRPPVPVKRNDHVDSDALDATP